MSNVAFAFEAPSTLALPRSSGLRELDEIVRDADAHGFVAVHATPAVLDAIGRHVERRTRALGRCTVRVDGLPSDDAWRELGARFPMVPVTDPLAMAQAIVDRAGSAVMVVRDAVPTAFGRAVSDEIARLVGAPFVKCLVIALAEGADPTFATLAGGEGRGRIIDVDAELAPDDLVVFWEAVARDAAMRGLPGLDRLDAMEAWWSAARATPVDHPAPSMALGADAARLLARIALSQRSWPASQLARLGKSSAADELIRAGAIVVDAGGRVLTGPSLSTASEATLVAHTPDACDFETVAGALATIADPWASARESELHAMRGAFDRAEQSAVRAVSSLADASARADFWKRWERTLAAMPEEEAVPRMLRSADLALRTGDVERALTLGNAALSRRPETFATLLTLGRANVARGDLPTASYWLDKASVRATDAAARARVEVEMAEVRHMEGDIDGARKYAQSALDAALAGDPCDGVGTRLHARNLLGKILLATSAWHQAEQHFAADACEAALSGDMMAELRARLNRSIALLSSGRLDEARAMLEVVLAEGEASGEVRAVAYALTNLATIAIHKREYAEALRLSERAFDARRRLGDKVSLALLISNLAELKLQLGQVAEAEQALAFGRKACGPGMPGARASHFAYTAALIHLERRRTVEAASEVKAALNTARGSGNGSLVAECHRLAARIALEDGDLASAEIALGHAAELADSPRERAWVSLIEAACARAAGAPFGEAAYEALERARAAADPELLREAHLLVHRASVLAEEPRAARAHLDAALGARDQIAETLPEDLRKRYLSRRDLAELARVEAAFCVNVSTLSTRSIAPTPMTGGEIAKAPPAPVSRVESVRVRSDGASQRRMVGRTAAMIALTNAIQKVGPSDATVLVHGESGTGKELVAEAIHESSPRRAGPLVKVNCAALVETLLLSELFGHEKGSFTGAAARRRGRFEAAEGGTLFLDEIGDISARTQVALLRVLQDKTFERVGGVTPIRANVRIVCATHRDLAAMVGRGEFREDLYYRLRGVVLDVPSLRNRIADLPTIADAILDRIAAENGLAPRRLAPAALEALARHAWPGNVRELENALRAAALFAEGEVIEIEDFTSNVASLRGVLDVATKLTALPGVMDPANGTTDAFDLAPMTQPSKSARSDFAELPQPSPVIGAIAIRAGHDGHESQERGESATDVAYAAVRGGVSLSDLKRDIERECIARALAETGGNITRAAGLLGMKRPRLSQLVKQYGFGGGATSGENGLDSLDSLDSEDGE